jgi:8-oxo-dGTP pyrophosphatase MutT (NUDIX family)
MNRRWRLKATHQVFANSRLQVFEDTVLQPDGSESTYTVVEDRAGSVTIVAVTNDERFVFVEQHRYPVDTMMLELPGGELARGQSAVEQAAVELADETGIVADRVQELGEFVPWSARARRRCVAVLAADLDTSGMAVHRQDGDEAIHRVRLLREVDVKRLIAAGEVIDGNALCALSIYWATFPGAGPQVNG